MTDMTIQGDPQGIGPRTADPGLIAATVAIGVALALGVAAASALPTRAAGDDRAVCPQRAMPYSALILH